MNSQLVHDSLARAWDRNDGRAEFSLQGFLTAACEELLRVKGIGATDLVLFASDTPPALICARPSNDATARGGTIPIETLTDFARRVWQEPRKIRVVDHKLAALRFIDSNICFSVTVKVDVDTTLIAGGLCAMWFGFGDTVVPTGELLNSLSLVADSLGSWIKVYGKCVGDRIAVLNERRSMKHRYREFGLLAHDARAPLSSIKYFLSEAPDCSAILPEVHYLEELLESFSDIARTGVSGIEDTGVVLSDRKRSCKPGGRCEVRAVVDRVLKRITARAHAKGVGVNLSMIPVQLYPTLNVPVSSLSFERILSNLMDNSLQYTSQGWIGLVLTVCDGRLRVRVTDSGCGIDPATVSELMNPEQESISGCTGWGVGLLSVKRVVQSVGGDLKIESALGRGTVIEIEMPMITDEPPQDEVAVDRSGDPELLLIDDDCGQLESLSRVLESCGVRCRSANSVAAGVEELDSNRYRAVICDSNMPDGGAEELLMTMKRKHLGAAVAVLSGDHDDLQLYRFAAQGAQAFFSKPADVGRLVTWVQNQCPEYQT